MAYKEHGKTPETMTLHISLPKQVAQDLTALAELYHATPERMIATWAQSHVENLMAGLTPRGNQPQDPRDAPDA